MYLFAFVFSHSFLAVPQSRNGQGTPTTASTKTCAGGPQKPVVNAKRGQVIPTQWERNNHNSGFVRYSIVDQQYSNVDNIFNDPKRVFHYECAEKECHSAEGNKTATSTLGGGLGTCKGSLTIPNWVKDGTYTIQWVWYATGGSYGDTYRGQIGFVTCSK